MMYRERFPIKKVNDSKLENSSVGNIKKYLNFSLLTLFSTKSLYYFMRYASFVTFIQIMPSQCF